MHEQQYDSENLIPSLLSLQQTARRANYEQTKIQGAKNNEVEALKRKNKLGLIFCKS